ncbi:MAG: hypothetical protein ACOYT8_06145 [Candidatus Dependentiae bacterium]
MKNLLYFLLLSFISANAVNTIGSWANRYLKLNKFYIENEKQIPAINTYAWLRYIYKQYRDITLNNQIRENNALYKAIIMNNTEKTTQNLNQDGEQLLLAY